MALHRTRPRPSEGGPPTPSGSPRASVRYATNAWLDHDATLADSGVVAVAAGGGTQQLMVPRHRTTTRHLAVLYPWQSTTTLGVHGVYLGHDLSADGGFYFDPFSLYRRGVVTSPNMIILGVVGAGKSTVVKTFLLRSVGLLGSGPKRRGRFVCVLDPKGEYKAMAQVLGMQHIKLQPGSNQRLNPLDVAADLAADEAARRRAMMLAALLAAGLRRDLTPMEDSAVTLAVQALPSAPTLSDVHRRLCEPTEEMILAGGVAEDSYRVQINELQLAVRQLLGGGSLGGLFDGRSTVNVDAMADRGVAVDLSEISKQDPSFGPAMVCLTSWLQNLVLRKGPDMPQRIQVLEEIWALLGNDTTTRYYQASQKLAREYGVANISVAHRLDDLTAQAPDGTAAAKIAAGLLADTDTRVVMRQNPEQVPATRDALGLTAEEARHLPTLANGCAIWRIGSHAAAVQHVVADEEFELIDTDRAMQGAT